MFSRTPLLFTPTNPLLHRRTTISRCNTNRILPRLSISPPRKTFNLIPLTTFIAYATRLFIVPPVSVSLTETFREALDLSLNFVYFLPALLPNLAAKGNHPVLEAFFHIVVFWDFLLLGFVSLDVTRPSVRPKSTPFLVASFFLTNIFYLPYLALRHSSEESSSDDNVNTENTYSVEKKNKLISFAESVYLPISSLGVVAVSIPWALFTRPEYGDLATRFSTFVTLAAGQDLLAYSLFVDAIVYCFFQSALVTEDANCRRWSSNNIRDRAVFSARFIPYFGLAFYLLQRAVHAPLKWTPTSEKV